MTQKETLAQIKAAGMSGRYDADTREYRVTLPPKDQPDAERREAIAYYTNDAKDALKTAEAMRKGFDDAKAQLAAAPEWFERQGVGATAPTAFRGDALKGKASPFDKAKDRANTAEAKAERSTQRQQIRGLER